LAPPKDPEEGTIVHVGRPGVRLEQQWGEKNLVTGGGKKTFPTFEGEKAEPSLKK